MEHQKILSLLNKVNNSKLVTRKWNIVTMIIQNQIMLHQIKLPTT